ncbi:jg20001 [Pararge aegeria aegeria]|uniref:Jg20001 protein n=1 Tax=Pararge aegeria aegeria TaxID=348720 RepID=A0A8S4R4N2_9NEOP|nr:jg20001 [Pararge aegeria aegeria]
MIELAKRGHQVTVITTDPAFPKQETPANFTEIDVHDVSYNIWRKYMLTAEENPLHHQSAMSSIFEKQFQSVEIQALINNKDKKFDLLFVDHFIRLALSYSYLYNVPVISFNSFGPSFGTFDSVDAVSHPLIFPIVPLRKFHNLNTLQKISQFYEYYATKIVYDSYEEEENKQLKRIFGPEIADIRDLKDNVDMTFLNTHLFWDNNRPVSPNIIYIGGIHKYPVNELLHKDLQSYLDQSTKGIIYMSFESNFTMCFITLEEIKLLTDVFSELPYNVILKWDNDLPGSPSNVKIGKWFPQAGLLRHKHVKAFITEGGYHSMSEAINAGVPLIGIPMLAEQWYNMELCHKHGIGIKLVLKSLTKKMLKSAIETVIGNNSYRNNIIGIRNHINDQPQTPLELAVWWTEYVLRHGGAKHLRSEATLDSVKHPLVYPAPPLQKFYNITTLERLYQWMLDNNRPVSPNILYVGGIHKNPVHDLPKDLQLDLDESIQGAIYISFGSMILTSLFNLEFIQLLTDVFSDLPYNVLLKWDHDIPGCPNNVKIRKWYPQSDLLRHKNVKLFITHGGYQSISESIDAAVPLIGIPMSLDQWYNIELCLKHEICVKLDFKTLTKEKLKNAIGTVIGNKSYRINILKLRRLIHDQPQPPLERAVWWTEIELLLVLICVGAGDN